MLSSLRFIPNALCILRMLLVVPVSWLLLQHDFVLTMWIFAVAAVTDGLDGFLAKRCGWTSELGKILDPLADKILLVGVFLTLAAMDLVPMWLAVVAIGRDVVITAGAILYNWLYGDPQGHPTWISKLNTLCQIVFLLLVVGAHALERVPQQVLTALGALVFVTTMISGIDYVLTYSRKAAAMNRRQRSLPV
ncbi:MAG TPA: CDP-alcohol phosphatidyltransferase family protein [Povalibacter sp.]|jgi:cardiolipin synthase|nr:CDP-alcohol phosphatidyltransferase family protein [Povalibacter sp.]